MTAPRRPRGGDRSPARRQSVPARPGSGRSRPAPLDVLSRLLAVEKVHVDRLEERRVQCHRLGNHLPVGEQPPADDLDLRQRSRGVKDPQRRVLQVAAGEEPLVGLGDRCERVGRRAQELKLRVARADLAHPGTEIGDRLIMGEEQPPLGQERMHERVADRSFRRLAEFRRGTRKAWTFSPSA